MKKRQVVIKRSEDNNSSSRCSSNSSFTVRTVRYGECQKNHAASVGGYAVDGCREYMPSRHEDDGNGNGGSLTCAACGCHRNFHRREDRTEVVSDASSQTSNIGF